MTRHRWFLALLLVLVGFLGGALFWANQQLADRGTLAANRQLVKQLQLTDLAFWSEARYARHPSQADWFSPHQDFPSSLEHFPAGSLIAPAPVKPQTRIEVRHHRQGGA